MSETAMVRTQVYLTEEQDRGLKSLAESSGRKQSELIREAIDRLLAENRPKDWKQALEAVRGMWADRHDLDELYGELRAEVEGRVDRLAGVSKQP
jgi:Arc/MetJ-type ribon-helix-helix transcriptional regulator